MAKYNENNLKKMIHGTTSDDYATDDTTPTDSAFYRYRDDNIYCLEVI